MVTNCLGRFEIISIGVGDSKDIIFLGEMNMTAINASGVYIIKKKLPDDRSFPVLSAKIIKEAIKRDEQYTKKKND